MATCWIALREAVKQHFGVEFVILGGGAYRDFDAQVRLFEQRYQFPAVPGLAADRYRHWNGRRYSLRDHMASAASPGTSNHGRGAAVDAAIRAADGQVLAITARGDVFAWLLDHAGEFGLSWELQSEPWHLRVTGSVMVASPLVAVNPIAPLHTLEQEDDAVVFKTPKTGDKLFVQDSTKQVRHISGWEGAVAEAASPGWASMATVLVVADDVAAWLNTL
jgi:hypothetical protein